MRKKVIISCKNIHGRILALDFIKPYHKAFQRLHIIAIISKTCYTGLHICIWRIFFFAQKKTHSNLCGFGIQVPLAIQFKSICSVDVLKKWIWWCVPKFSASLKKKTHVKKPQIILGVPVLPIEIHICHFIQDSVIAVIPLSSFFAGGRFNDACEIGSLWNISLSEAWIRYVLASVSCIFLFSFLIISASSGST